MTHLDLTAKQIGQLGGGEPNPRGGRRRDGPESRSSRRPRPELTTPYRMGDRRRMPPRAGGDFRTRRRGRSRSSLDRVNGHAVPTRRPPGHDGDALRTRTPHHAPSEAGPAPRALRLIVHPTAHQTADEGQHIQATFRGLVEDGHPTAAICDDVATACRKDGGRNCLVLTRWTEHLVSITTRGSPGPWHQGVGPARPDGQEGSQLPSLRGP